MVFRMRSAAEVFACPWPSIVQAVSVRREQNQRGEAMRVSHGASI